MQRTWRLLMGLKSKSTSDGVIGSIGIRLPLSKEHLARPAFPLASRFATGDERHDFFLNQEAHCICFVVKPTTFFSTHISYQGQDLLERFDPDWFYQMGDEASRLAVREIFFHPVTREGNSS